MRGERYAASATHQNHRAAAISSMIPRERWVAWQQAVDGARAHRDRTGLGIRFLWRRRAHRCTGAAAAAHRWAWVLVLVVLLEVGIAGPETGRAPSASISNSPVISTVANVTSHVQLLAAWLNPVVHLTRGQETGSVLHALICNSHATPPAASAMNQSLTMLEPVESVATSSVQGTGIVRAVVTCSLHSDPRAGSVAPKSLTTTHNRATSAPSMMKRIGLQRGERDCQAS